MIKEFYSTVARTVESTSANTCSQLSVIAITFGNEDPWYQIINQNAYSIKIPILLFLWAACFCWI